MARAWIGISGYVYQHWRGKFYPEGMAQKRWLAHAVERFNSIELNGTFYSLKWPAIFERWEEAVRHRPDFVYAVKGGKYITHNLKLRNADTALANFFGSGVLALGRHLGPFLWQLPASVRYDRARLEPFLHKLPRDTAEAAWWASQHDERLKRGSLTVAGWEGPLRHALEVRHESYDCEEFYDLLRRYGVACVVADTAGRFLYSEHVTADFAYVRLHGSQILYVSRYTDAELDAWAARMRAWNRDVYVYFDNDGLGHAPYDAMRLAQRVRSAAAP